MALTRKDLAKKTESELLSLATASDIDVPAGADKDEIIDLVLAVDASSHAEDVIIASDPAKVKAKTSVPSGPKKYRVIVHNQDGVDSSKFISVQVNGYLNTIPREVEVVLSEEYVHVLENAVVDRHMYEDGRLVIKPARRFPFTVLGPA